MDSYIIKEDLENILCRSNIKWRKLSKKTILITGATGEIGRAIIRTLLYVNKYYSLDLKVIAVVRNRENALEIFKEQLKYDSVLLFWESSVETIEIHKEKIDYIIHGASPTKGKYFIEYPVETIWTNVEGTRRILEIAKANDIRSMVYLSSMEIYGGTDDEVELEETSGTTIDTMNVRSSYPESKRMGENLCMAYKKEYGVKVKVIRLAQTFGAGISKTETRVYAQFANAVLKRQDILLHTKGNSRRGYLYISDAVNAILTVLLYGQDGEAYNAVNEATYCSIYEMAQLVAERVANDEIKVVVKEDIERIQEYPKSCNLRLSSKKLKELGWNATVDLESMYTRMIKYMEEKY